MIIKENVSLANYSSYQIGGKARYLAEPDSLSSLKECLKFATDQNLRVFVFGAGSNTLFADKPYPNTLYVNLKNFISMDLRKESIFFSAGIPLSLIAFFGILGKQNDLSFTYLLPGTLGAGIFINAKYGDFQIGDFVQSVHYLDEDLNIQTLPASLCRFAYKKSLFQEKKLIIIGAEFKRGNIQQKEIDFLNKMIRRLKQVFPIKLPDFYQFFHSYREELSKKHPIPKSFDEIEQYRISKHHFDFPSCGSVFKNNYDFGRPTGALVEELGLKGLAYGDAQIAPYHGNIILNRGKASASDVLYLIHEIQTQIQKNYGFTPEPEVRIIP